MLKSLSVKNYALLADVEVSLHAGLTILTGETGAGKSIIIAAMGAILGQRVDTSVLRDGASKAVIEGHFDIACQHDLRDLLRENDLLTHESHLILRREIYDTARTRAFVNDIPVPVTLLQNVGELLVDLHGQHDHQSLLKVATHLAFLDEFADLHEKRAKVASAYRQVQALAQRLSELEQKRAAVEEKRAFYQLQIDEINKVNPLDNEEEELTKEEKIAKHGEKLFHLTNEFYRILYDDEVSVFDRLTHVRQGLDELGAIDEQFNEYKKDLESARSSVEELSTFFRNYASELEFSPEHFEHIQARLSALAGLKKKLGRSIPEILAFRDEMAAKITDSGNLQTKIEELKQDFESATARLSHLAVELSKERKQAAEELEKKVPEILQHLGMPAVRFKVALSARENPDGLVAWQGKRYQVSVDGMDFAEFLISVNKGEKVRSLTKVASGGEISRIMLALKSLAAKQGQVPILIFDEIDNGISGRIAQAVGRKLKDLAELHQILCVTHLPQIASMGEHHYLVEKSEKQGRIETNLRELSKHEREEAIARLLAGDKVSESHLSSARELMEDAVVD